MSQSNQQQGPSARPADPAAGQPQRKKKRAKVPNPARTQGGPDSEQACPLPPEPDPVPARAAEQDPVATEVERGREANFQRLQQEALQQQDPLRTVLRGASGDLLELAYQMQQTVKRSAKSVSLDELEQLAPAVDALLKVFRQADRFANLEHKHAQQETRRDSERK